MVAHHYEPGEDTEYALVMMDIAGMQSQISQMRQLSKQIQDAILKNSEDAFKELEEERTKNKE